MSAIFILQSSIVNSPAATHYVWTNSPAPSAPFTNWTTAAHVIQEAVDAAVDGDMVLVTNGVYAMGSRALPAVDWAANRLAVTNAILVQGMNGPPRTFIIGGNGTRGAFVGNHGILSGFTLTDGALSNLGGRDHANGAGVLCGTGGTISNCVLRWNSVSYGGSGGGICGGTAINCTLEFNSADHANGGGMARGTARNCVIRDNRGYYGGGTAGNTNDGCTIIGNQADSRGGGTVFGLNRSCLIIDNVSTDGAGGTWACDNANCAIIGNQCNYGGGGSLEGENRNCTIVNNLADNGGGTLGSSNSNCIVYYNTARLGGANCQAGTVLYSCSTPLPVGEGNCATEPALMGLRNPHLLPGSPCIDAGSADFVRESQDVDGEPRVNGAFVDMGCDEFYEDGLTGALSVVMEGAYDTAVVGADLTFTAEIAGMAKGFSWTCGDLLTAVNTLRVRYSWPSTGNSEVVLTAWNDSMSTAVTTLVSIVSGYTNFVSHQGEHVPPFTTWATAATNIQDAISAMPVVGGTVLVTNGTYGSGGLFHMGLMNRIAVLTPCQVRSVNGAGDTRIVGEALSEWSYFRCAYLGSGATLSGFTLTNGHTFEGDVIPVISQTFLCGGGAYCEDGALVTDCVVTGNTSTLLGGGICGGMVRNCVVANNTCSNAGGGIAEGTVWNCTIIGNRAVSGEGGGLYGGLAFNTICVDNTAGAGGENYSTSANISHSCTFPLAPGSNNIALAPRFVDAIASWRLSPSSPCIDRGINDRWMYSSVDLDGISRIIHETVDMGACEFHIDANLRAVLQGPYVTGNHTMAVASPSNSPPSAPYAADRSSAGVSPSNTVDWVLIQIRPEMGGKAIFSRSGLLVDDGSILEAAGDANLIIEVAPLTTNYLLIAHRNHLAAMSAQPIAFTNQLITYDFTTGPDKYYGGTNGCIELEPGVWGMIAGDADGDGKVTWGDRVIVSNSVGKTGYLSADLDLDGEVDGNDD